MYLPACLATVVLNKAISSRTAFRIPPTSVLEASEVAETISGVAVGSDTAAGSSEREGWVEAAIEAFDRTNG